MPKSSDNNTYKIVLLGDGSDKSVLLHKFVANKFQKHYMKTIGVEPYSRYESIDGKRLCFSIWDIPHQDRFRLTRIKFYKNIHGALVVFDLTKLDTFLNVDKWINELKIESPDAHLILIGMLNTEEINITVTVEEVQAKVNELGAIMYIETSMQSGEYIEEAFTLLGKKFLEEK